MELSPEQLFYVGLIASAFVQALRLVADWFEYSPSREVTTVALWVLSIPVAISFGGLPEFSGADPAELAQSVLTAATTVLGSSTVIYQLLMRRVFRQPDRVG